MDVEIVKTEYAKLVVGHERVGENIRPEGECCPGGALVAFPEDGANHKVSAGVNVIDDGVLFGIDDARKSVVESESGHEKSPFRKNGWEIPHVRRGAGMWGTPGNDTRWLSGVTVCPRIENYFGAVLLFVVENLVHPWRLIDRHAMANDEAGIDLATLNA